MVHTFTQVAGMHVAYRRTDKATKRQADKRARILKAARDLVADGGWSAAQVGGHVAAVTTRSQLCAEIVATVSTREVGIARAVADADGSPSDKLANTIRTFAGRALQGRRLAYALIAEPVDPEVETVRLDYRAQLAHCFERILREGIMRGAFPRHDPAVAAACIVGAFMEALVGPLAPAKGTGPRADRHLIEQITQFCLRASVGAPEAKP